MENYIGNNGYTFNKRLNDELQQFIVDFDGDYFVTAVFNRETNLAGAEKRLEHWSNCVNRKLYGKKWFKLPATDRLQYIGAPEHLNSNLHWHMTLKLAGGKKDWRFAFIAPKLWQKYNQSGSMDVQKVLTAQDQITVGSYITKDTWLPSNYNSVKYSK